LWLDTATTGWHYDDGEQKEKMQENAGKTRKNQENELRRPPMDNQQNQDSLATPASGL
jgi:hypothetical protein